jgi:hypothetical protein
MGMERIPVVMDYGKNRRKYGLTLEKMITQ